MQDLLNIILTNLQTVGLCLILLLFFRVADMLFGIANAKKQKIVFNKKKFLWGLFYTLCFVAGLATFVTAVSMVIPVIKYCQLVADESILKTLDVINVTVMSLSILTVSVVTYGKDAYDKFKQFIQSK